MKLSDHVVLAWRSSLGFSSAFLLSGLFVVGCVSLTKPLEVQKCSSSSAGCSDDPNQIIPSGDDAKDSAKNDTVDNPSPDLALGVDKPIGNSDGGSDVPSTVADGPVDKSDSATDSKDTAAKDVRDFSDVFDAVTPPDDGPSDKAPGAEPGPEPPGAEPGAEPSSGPEPGPEPGLEPGPEPGREPGLEPGPEPGPEPAPEPGPDAGTGPCSAATLVTMGAGKTQGSFALNTTGAICVYTCDTVQGWNCSNFAGRTEVVNGTSVTCPDSVNQPGVAQKNGYVVFQISAGSKSFASFSWWGSPGASTCAAPAGGF